MSEPIIDHVGVKVSDFARSKAFYQAVLGALGINLLSDFDYEGSHYAGFGSVRPTFWIDDNVETRVGPAHIAFAAAGGRDNGAPGLRPHYAPDYYAAFVHDPDGHNIEALRVGPPEDRQ